MDSSLNSAALAALIAFFAGLILCPRFIPFLTKIKFGQTVRTDGPQTHLKKTGTPTMGGIVIIISFVAGSAFFLMGNSDGLIVMFITLSFGLIGFADDYIKVVKKRSLGLRAYQKFICQVFITGVFVFYLYNSKDFSTWVYVPFANGLHWDLGYFYIPFIFIVMLGTVNGANFTDGLDGLASGVTILVVTFFLFMASAAGNTGLLPVSGAAAGALLAFLLFNAYPARIMMGDTGSLALGSLVAAVAVILKAPLLIPIVALIYMVEVLSVMIQVSYFKITKGKRIFKMAPLHHHFEMMGWPETRVVAVFYIVTAVCCLIGFLSASGGFYGT